LRIKFGSKIENKGGDTNWRRRDKVRDTIKNKDKDRLEKV